MDDSSPSEEQVLRDIQRNSGSSNAEEDGDFAIAKALQDQERAFLALQRLVRRNARENRQEGEEADSDEEADEDDVDDEDDSGDGHSDEDDAAYARRLQDQADREHYARLMDGHGTLEAALQGAGIAEERASDEEYDPDENDYLTDDSIDPDEMTYEELQALSEAVGSVSRGVPQTIIDALPHAKYCSRFPPGSTRTEEEEEEQCAVCRMEFEPDEEVALLPCKHLYHGECIAQWLKDRKACPICGRELQADNTQPGKGIDTVMEQPGSK
ncbi:g582 [Coccomyxa viridis]|uniref:G582 protein n=1 Tax=Coccomyxa viridis TaxID=1274662 RepID=A0ABP1FG71_9CHLO